MARGKYANRAERIKSRDELIEEIDALKLQVRNLTTQNTELLLQMSQEKGMHDARVAQMQALMDANTSARLEQAEAEALRLAGELGRANAALAMRRS